MRKALFIVVLASCNNTTKLNRVCPTSCYIMDADTQKFSYKTAGVGECKPGKPVCDENMNVVSCDGVVYPSTETCDGLDNDCDGNTDENLSGLTSYNSNGMCRFRGECDGATINCVAGKMECHYPGVVEDTETLCDGKDNDCDGQVDEDLFTGQYCYTGQVGTESVAPCHPGILACNDGNIECSNQMVPSFERCDQIDNDCNGIVDDTGDVLSNQYDMVFAYDTSGSMCEEITATLVATEVYAGTLNDNNFKFAIVVISSVSSGTFVSLEQDFTNITEFRNELMWMDCDGTGTEASYDAMYSICDKTNNPLGLSWRASANPIYFGFTDEKGQSYVTPELTKDDVMNKCSENGVLMFQWSANPEDFESICDGTGGQHFAISSDSDQMLDDLNSIIITLCGAN